MGSAVDKHRKQLKKKELKKNKAKREEVRASVSQLKAQPLMKREQQREFQLVKKDVRGIQDEIRQLEQNSQRTKEENERLGSLRAQVARSIKAKEKYAEEHPEARELLFPVGGGGGGTSATRNDYDDNGKGLYTKDGKLRHPERSAYYHPVFNPFGVPPPGMPYKEREMTPQSSSSSSSSGDSDDDVPMPDGAPPSDSDSSDDDSLADIPMPEGPPPPKGLQRNGGRPIQFPQPHHYDPARRTIPIPPRPIISGQPTMYAPPPPPALQSANITPASSTTTVPPAMAAASKSTAAATGQTPPAAATISAAPVLRDLKKEATAFVPHVVKRKK